MKRFQLILCFLLCLSVLSGCSAGSLISLPKGVIQSEDISSASMNAAAQAPTEDEETADPTDDVSFAEETDTELDMSEEDTEEADVQSTEEKAETPVDKLLASLSLREKILQMMIISPEQIGCNSLYADEASAAALAEMPVGGFIFFSDNLEDRYQTTEFLSGLQQQSNLGLFMAVDEEGGIVSRLGNNPEMGVTAFDSMGYQETKGDAYHVGQILGRELQELGFNLDFAPVADVNSNSDNTVIGIRAFSSDASTAAEMVSACVEGFVDNGMLCTLKHFPGHGDTDSDSHVGSAVTYKTLSELRECEFLPFAAGIKAGAPFVMLAHISLPNVYEDPLPASLSYEICTELLREELGFDGIIITDSLKMDAISDVYDSGEAAVLAIRAGVDILLMPTNPYGALEGVLRALDDGLISEDRINESVRRILQQKLASGIITD